MRSWLALTDQDSHYSMIFCAHDFVVTPHPRIGWQGTQLSYLGLSRVSLQYDLLEGEEHLHHTVLKEDGEGGDDSLLLRMYLPVLSLVEDLNV